MGHSLRPEEGSVLEQDAELLAHLVEALLPQPHDLVAIDPDLSALGTQQPEMFLSNTDFPVPGGPRIAVILPFGTSKVMSSSTVWEPNDFVTPRREMIGSPGAIQAGPVVSRGSSI